MNDDERSPRSITVAGYDELAAKRADVDVSPWGDSAYQRHYVWPGVRPLLPDVAGKRVLDAGCGIGEYVGWFLERGADAVGVDASGRALAVARERFGDEATFHRADLAEPLDVAAEGGFDLVFCNLVLDHVEDWRPVLAEFRRILTADGALVFSTIHPFRRYRRHRDELSSYHETEAYLQNWDDTGARLAQYHRPVSEIFDSLADAAFRVDEFREITPPERYEAHDPERYEVATTEPDTLCVRALPSGADG